MLLIRENLLNYNTKDIKYTFIFSNKIEEITVSY